MEIHLKEFGSLIPQKATCGSVTYDLFSSEKGEILPRARKFVSTGILIKFPETYYGKIWGLQNLAYRGIDTFNQIIDNDYNYIIKILLINNSFDKFKYTEGCRIARLSIHKSFNLDISIANGVDILENIANNL